MTKWLCFQGTSTCSHACSSGNLSRALELRQELYWLMPLRPLVFLQKVNVTLLAKYCI